MWWLIGLLAALGATSSNNAQNSAVGGTNRTSDPGSSSRTLTYRSRDGSAFFRFCFTPLNGDVRIYLLEYPGNGSCHVLRDTHGPYICWSTTIRSMAAAKAVAAMWAEATLVYQRTGRAF